jgi:hypothetical protein
VHHRTPLPLPYPHELPGVVAAHRDALAATENPRPKAFSTTHHRQAGMVSPAALCVPRDAPNALRVLVPTASPRLISRATGYGRATARRQSLFGQAEAGRALLWTGPCGHFRPNGSGLSPNSLFNFPGYFKSVSNFQNSYQIQFSSKYS